MKTDKNYKMSKRLKTTLALTKWRSNEERGAYKRLMSEAEMDAKFAKPFTPKEN